MCLLMSESIGAGRPCGMSSHGQPRRQAGEYRCPSTRSPIDSSETFINRACAFQRARPAAMLLFGQVLKPCFRKCNAGAHAGAAVLEVCLGRSLKAAFMNLQKLSIGLNFFSCNTWPKNRGPFLASARKGTERGRVMPGDAPLAASAPSISRHRPVNKRAYRPSPKNYRSGEP